MSPANLDEDVDKEHFASSETRGKSQARFVNGYNWSQIRRLKIVESRPYPLRERVSLSLLSFYFSPIG